MNFNNITTLATGLAAWAVEMAGQEETPAYLVGTLALGALAAFGAYVYAYNQRSGHVASDLSNNHSLSPESHVVQDLDVLELNLDSQYFEVASNPGNNVPLLPESHVAQNPDVLELNFESQNLEIAPDLNNVSQLQFLNLSHNLLNIPPDLSHTPQLLSLDLRNNLLNIPPDLSHTPQLQDLDLSENDSLSIAPNLSYTPQLHRLDLNNNQLAVAPDLSHTPRLRHLSLGFNELVIAPDLSHTPELRFLYLNSNRLEVAPDLSHTPHLEYLYLSDNHSIVPNLNHTPQLQQLYLTNNELAALPDLSHLPQLRYLNLNNNQFTELPDSILSLSRDCEVDAERNRFSAEYVAEFQERLRQHRLAHPDQGPTVHMSIYDDAAAAPLHGAAPVVPAPNVAPPSLEEELAVWSQEFEIAFPESDNPQLWAERQPIGADLQEHFAQLHFLSVDEKMMLANYLRRLRHVQDYGNGGEDRRGIVLRVERMLQLANQNPAFRREMLQLIQQGSVSCGDRVQLYFDEIEIAWHFSNRELSPEEFRQLAIRSERCRQLQLYAERQAHEHQFGDEVETVLYYRVFLRDALNLPVSTRNMLYPGISGVTQEMLNAARVEIAALSDDQLLATSPHWQARMAQLHQNRVNDITNQYLGFLNDLGDYFDLESTGEQEQYLEERDNLAELIGRAISLDIVGYPAISGFIDLERQRVISELI